MINITNLSKSYGSKQVLKDINLRMVSSKVYGFVGNNGAGKTTLFKAISGMEQCMGDIDSTYGRLRNCVGYLETNPLMMSYITGWEYLRLMTTARKQVRTDFYECNIFDLPLDEYTTVYSTGMKKKLALMGILLQNNEVFILDEPFNGVDLHSNIMILEIIKKLKSKDKIVLISSHIFSTLSEVCDSIAILKNGTIAKEIFPEDYGSLQAEMNQTLIHEKIDLLIP